MATDYISRETAISKITDLINKSGKYTEYESGADDACYIIEHDVPASNVVEVVRCGECRERTSGRPFCQGRPKDWFCANGARWTE